MIAKRWKVVFSICIALLFLACGNKKNDGLLPPELDKFALAFASDREGSMDLFLYKITEQITLNLTKGRTPLAYGPVFDPNSRRIAFSSKRRGNVDIFVIGTDGKGLQNLTDHPANDGSPAWSPDGKQLAFVSDRLPNSAEIFIMDMEGGEPYQMTQNNLFETSPAFSPDGGSIAFCRQLRPDPDNLKTVNGDLFFIKKDEHSEIALTSDPNFDSHPDYSPDGKQIAYHSCNDTLCNIWLMDADGGNKRQLTKDKFDNRFPRWSPDGRWIAFTSVRFRQTDIWIVRPDGSDMQAIIRNPGRDEVACWVTLSEP